MELALKLCLALESLTCSLSGLLSTSIRNSFMSFGNVTLARCCLIAEVQTVSDSQRKKLSTKLPRVFPRQYDKKEAAGNYVLTTFYRDLSPVFLLSQGKHPVTERMKLMNG